KLCPAVDRAVDRRSPLVAITLVANAEDDGSRTRELLDLARELWTARDTDAGTTARLLEEIEAVIALVRTPALSIVAEASASFFCTLRSYGFAHSIPPQPALLDGDVKQAGQPALGIIPCPRA